VALVGDIQCSGAFLNIFQNSDIESHEAWQEVNSLVDESRNFSFDFAWCAGSFQTLTHPQSRTSLHARPCEVLMMYRRVCDLERLYVVSTVMLGREVIAQSTSTFE
jgi:hypothetical protein